MTHTSRYTMLAIIASMASMASAQDTYDANNMMNDDLNGTARFVAMGGALGALGGDISVMGTNPAGTAVYRKSDAAFTVGGLFTKDDGMMGHDKSRMSLDQAGAVFTFDMHNPMNDGLQYVNFGVNYQKRRNFLGNNFLNIQNLDGHCVSQTFQVADLANYCYDNDLPSWGLLADMSAPSYYEDGTLKRDGIVLEDMETGYYGVAAEQACYKRATYGGVSQVDVNLSFNNSDRYFWGFSLGLYDVNYNRESFYAETGVDGCQYDFTNWYTTYGQGFDIKFGFICRPVDDSPFRFGLSLHTPTWYGLTDANGSNLYINDNRIYPSHGAEWVNGDYDYQLRTPWKFGVSLGHTIGSNIALGAEWEYQDQSTAHFQTASGNYNSGDQEYFRSVNAINKETLKGQHTLKLGAEYKPVDNVAFRIGYNLVTSPFKDGAFRTIAPDGPYTETDYTNWKNMNRYTLGVSFRFNGGYFDMAYQYQTQKGDFYAFDNYDGKGSIYTLEPTPVKNDRGHLMGTLGFRF